MVLDPCPFFQQGRCRYGSSCSKPHFLISSLLDPPTWIFSYIDSLDLNVISQEEVRYSLMVGDTRRILDDMWVENYTILYSKLNEMCKKGNVKSSTKRCIDLRKNPECFNLPFDIEYVEKKIMDLRERDPIDEKYEIQEGEEDGMIGDINVENAPSFIKEYAYKSEANINKKEDQKTINQPREIIESKDRNYYNQANIESKDRNIYQKDRNYHQKDNYIQKDRNYQQKDTYQPRDNYQNRDNYKKDYQFRDTYQNRENYVQKDRNFQPRDNYKKDYQPRDTYQPRDIYQNRDKQSRNYQPKDTYQSRDNYQPRDTYQSRDNYIQKDRYQTRDNNPSRDNPRDNYPNRDSSRNIYQNTRDQSNRDQNTRDQSNRDHQRDKNNRDINVNPSLSRDWNKKQDDGKDFEYRNIPHDHKE